MMPDVFEVKQNTVNGISSYVLWTPFCPIDYGYREKPHVCSTSTLESHISIRFALWTSIFEFHAFLRQVYQMTPKATLFVTPYLFC